MLQRTLTYCDLIYTTEILCGNFFFFFHVTFNKITFKICNEWARLLVFNQNAFYVQNIMSLRAIEFKMEACLKITCSRYMNESYDLKQRPICIHKNKTIDEKNTHT